MSRWLRGLAWLVLAGGARAAVAPPTVEDYGKLPAAAEMRLSPQGDRVAYLAFDQGKRFITVRGVDGSAPLAFEAGDVKLRYLIWPDDTHVIVAFDSHVYSDIMLGGQGDISETLVINVVTSKAFSVFAHKPKVLGATFGYFGHASNGDHAYGYFGGLTLTGGGSANADFDTRRYPLEHSHTDLYRVDLDTGDVSVASGGSEKTSTNWLVDGEGRIVARDEYDQKTGERRIYAGSAQEGVITRFPDPTGDHGIVGMGRQTGTILLHQQSAEGGQWTIREYEARPGGASVDPFGGESVRATLLDSKGLLMGWVSNADQPKTTLFDPTLQARFDLAARAFKGERASLAAATDNLDRLVVHTEGPGDSGTYFFADIPAHKASALAWAYPTILQDVVGPVSILDYQAADGLRMQGVLTLPPGRPAKALPVVVLPHGGPEARDYLGFDWLAQAFASRGYAVFQPNFRGSDGFGRAFRDAGYGQWGRKMQTDVSDGLAELVRQGIADPKRACVVGASYGGYVALAGVTLQQGLYRCAVAIAPVSDLNKMLAWREERFGQQSDATRSDHAFMGAASPGDPGLKALSPDQLAARADAPVLLIHGKQDETVPFEQSDLMRYALSAAGKPVTLVELSGEDHYLSKAATRIQAIEAAVAFVQKNNPAD